MEVDDDEAYDPQNESPNNPKKRQREEEPIQTDDPPKRVRNELS